MTDFTTVIRRSVGRTAESDPESRARVYDQVYAVMMAQIGRQQPPLSEDEVADRVAMFEESVRTVEAEYAPPTDGWNDAVADYAEADPADEEVAEGDGWRAAEEPPRVEPRFAPPPPAEPPLPPSKRQRLRASPQPDPRAAAGDAEPATRTRPPAIDMTWDAAQSAWRDADANDVRAAAGRSATGAAFPAGWGGRISAAVGGKSRNAPGAAAPSPPARERRLLPAPAPPAPPLAASARPGLLAGIRTRLPGLKRRAAPDDIGGGFADDPDAVPISGNPASAGYPTDADFAEDADAGLADPSPAQKGFLARPRRRAAVIAAAPPPRKPRRVGRILFTVVGAFCAAALGWTAYVFVPLLFGSDEAPPATIAAVDPALASPNRAVRTVLPFDPGTPSAGDVAETIILFNGENPTAFSATADNPVRFRGDSGAGIARIGTSAGSPGARAVVGPGIAQRLGGKSFRMLVELRAAPDNPAGEIRFAYQRGLEVSAWQSASLPADFTTLGLEFALPDDGQARGNDYLIIEPGIPGDGTAADIRSIKVEVLP